MFKFKSKRTIETKMKNKKISDIPTKPILKFLSELDGWGYWFEGERSVQKAMPKGINYKLILAKMRKLIKQGYVDGCACGCRGDFEITEKGKDYLTKL